MVIISQKGLKPSLLSCQAGISREGQAESEYDFEKTKPIYRVQHELKVF
jgi:hypothetical protein